MNVVALIGNLATEVDLREVGDDKRVASFLLAVDRPSQGGGADFFRVAVWNKQAELCARYLAKGRRIGVDGRLKSRSWDDADGKKRREVEVVANHVEFLSPPPDGAGAGAEVPFEAAAVR